MMDAYRPTTSEEAIKRAEAHEHTAKRQRSEGKLWLSRAAAHERWAQRWREWAAMPILNDEITDEEAER